MSSLQDKVALVTGGSKGIGRSIVDKLLQEGAKVVIADENISPVEDLIQLKGTDLIMSCKVNVAEESEVISLVEKVIDRFGKIDILVNNAGISALSKVVNTPVEEWERIMNVNAKGVFLVSKHVATHMINHGVHGKIVNISSQAGKNGYKFLGSYASSKHAVLGFTKVLALELSEYQINVNAVCPGIIETDMKRRERVWGGDLRGVDAGSIEAEDHSQVPLGRTGSPSDVAETVFFLSSSASDYITGESINVSGGMTMN